ncbi:MAG: putative ATPase or kinase [uncultured bacterium]|nr:MAG: putative ATPase or kinase [uncultured bacterium]
MMTKHLNTEEELQNFAGSLAKLTPDNIIIYLDGPLGAGKTTFSRGFLRGLGYQEKVKSPTYTLVEPYEVSGKKIFHFDLYRLQDVNELEHIGIHDYFSQNAIFLIEWPEKGDPLLPPADLSCHFSFEDHGRVIKINAHTLRGEEVLKDAAL